MSKETLFKDLEQSEQLEKYYKVKTQIKELQELEGFYKIYIKDIVWSADNSTIEDSRFRMTIGYRPKWKYSPELMEQETNEKETMKVLKREEQLGGIAKQISNGGYLKVNLK